MMKTSAQTTPDSPSSIIASQLCEVPVELQGALPQLDSMRRYIRKHREAIGSPKLVADTREQLPELYNTFSTSSGEDFVKWDSEPEPCRIVLFSTNSNLQHLESSSHWFAVGTFKTSPLLFDQLYVISGLKIDGVAVSCFPLVFALTPNRTTATYRRLLQKLQELKPGLKPRSVMSDFEKASLAAYTEVFPHTERRGCFFHYRQANKRRIQRKNSAYF